MNILVPHNWILDFVETDATPAEIAEKLSLHALSVENITKTSDGDHIFEIEITPNRPDALSVLGVAREVGAIFTQHKTEAEFKDKEPRIRLKKPENPLNLDVRIKKPNLCPRFSAVILDNVEIKESPQKIQKRLEKVGIRSLNNAIDITNYLMIERGQPMHVFDYEKIAGNKMILRESREGETLTTLDGKKRELPPGTIVIQDQDKLIDLCGIMGGANSCVDMGTTRIVLFVQIYNPQRIRETTQKMSFRTDASARFEKSMDPQGVVPALKHATKFLRENANAQIASKLIDIENQKYGESKIILSEEDVEKVLGVEVDPRQICTILRALGFEIDWLTSPDDISGAPELRATVPSWRSTDIQESIDLVEEVARIYGYHNIPSKLPPLPKTLYQQEKIFQWEKLTKKYLEGWGYTEVKTTSFTNESELRNANLELKNTLRVQNPLTEDAT
ncbi:MAG: phenylalanine--tRNA ligase subunit beta, partial [Patescibacteria group bacterium]|nr:phenylalanine--tRNA ligase subunit beta [Patescibacteria group bacterium]